MKSKKGMLNVDKMFNVLIGIVILMAAFGIMLPLVATYGDNISGTGYAGASLFSSSNGILILILIASILIAIIKSARKAGK